MAQGRKSPGYRWAREHLLPTPGAMAAWNFQERLEASQWDTPAQHAARQLKLAGDLLRHAAANVPFYRERLAALGLPSDKPLDLATWRRIPVLTRREVQDHKTALTAKRIPPEHGRMSTAASSGSTGAPVEVLVTELNGSWNKALQFRGKLWALPRFDRRIAIIRRYGVGVATFPDGVSGDSWMDELTMPVETGTTKALNASTPVAQQIEWLNRVNPDVLFTYPTVLKTLLDTADASDVELPNVERIFTISEPVDNELRTAARRGLGADIFDVYSANEIGTIAIQCPDSDAYHIQAEAMMVEVIAEDGRPCAPGNTGRVVITHLHGFAMPIIRYEIGDMATVGKTCRCGRGLPVLTRIVGRQRNMMIGAKGERFRPSLGWKHIRRMAPIDQGQFVQTAVDRLEAKVVAKRALTDAEADAVRAHLKSRMPQLNEIAFVYVDDVPRSESGKFEDFISLLRPDDPLGAV